MAIAVEVTFRGENATMENYFKAIEMLGATPEGPHPDPGNLFHWVTDIGGGYRVTDVWKTKEQFEKFIQEKVGPVQQELGIAAPEVKFVDVANYQTAG